MANLAIKDSFATPLGSGTGILAALGQYHEEAGPHGGLADLAANARDAGATKWQLQGWTGTLDQTGEKMDVVACSDDGPGPCLPGSTVPSAEALLRMVKPGTSTSTDDASKIGMAGVGSLTGSLSIGGSVLFVTQGVCPTTALHRVYLLLVSERFGEQRKAEGCLDAEIIQASFSRGQPDEVGVFELLLQWSPFSSFEQLRGVLQLLLPPSGSLIQLIWDLRDGIELQMPPTKSGPPSAFDVLLPLGEAHPQAYPASARKFLQHTFPAAYHLNGRRFDIVMGRLGNIATVIQPFDPRVNVHHLSTPIVYKYKGVEAPVAKVSTPRRVRFVSCPRSKLTATICLSAPVGVVWLVCKRSRRLS